MDEIKETLDKYSFPSVIETGILDDLKNQLQRQVHKNE